MHGWGTSKEKSAKSGKNGSPNPLLGSRMKDNLLQHEVATLANGANGWGRRERVRTVQADEDDASG